MSASLRWSLVALVALVGVVVALLSTIGNSDQGPGPGAAAPTAPTATAPPAGSPPAEEPYTTVDPDTRAAAGLPACRDGAVPATTVGPVAGLMVRCMDDGDTTTLGKIQAGTPMLVNLWAYWCEPCRRELPAIRDAQATLGDSVRVVLSHTDPSETKGFDTLSALGIEDLISVSDPDEDLPTLLGAPPVLPLTVFVRADGTVAHVLVEPMDSEQDVLDAVEEHLGVTA
ncbi:TlpA disulfide reductase family protein [Rhodococcus sp. IEGM 1408]|uniref:TlpA family protein disulfide reductase n=1 Tax=Rhodococcus sp. IEGM 1408 TaxID=3082220 RepID=UPI002953BEB5|nr:TlpA disulfide reductase family protein [Rhodococcus sp. IEGM 1408]MDV8002237.1 TlpA disulfide reductase family protein [Rhodococcus sp. IEGM 1408]